MTKLKTKFFISSLLLFFFVAISAFFYFWSWLNTEQNIPVNQQQHMIEKGSNIYREAKKLQVNGVLRWPRVWIYYARFKKLNDLKAGEYQLNKSETPLSLLGQLTSGKTIKYSVTLIEGHRFTDFINTLHSHEAVFKTLEPSLKATDSAKLNFDVSHLEGWFFPDTYTFSRGDTDLSILERAHAKMRLVLEQEWEERSENLPYKSSYEALIMASIIEKETGVPYERPDISGVFVRRLEKGMKLQTDPTIIYGMGEDYKGNIRRKDLREATPYNTYVINGLPPTPIAMPGREAIRAALNPKEGSALFFVAKGDGTHQFSTTYQDHNAAVNKYQKIRVKNYQSKPPKSTAKSIPPK